MGLIISLYTNATLINDEIIQCLVKAPPAKVSISIYGASPATYEKVTGNADSYEKTVTNIQKLINADIKVELKTTLSSITAESLRNWQDWREVWVRTSACQLHNSKERRDRDRPPGKQARSAGTGQYQKTRTL
jgi:sulfatase maturation enzyme AslB (radical SAM superfamily)